MALLARFIMDPATRDDAYQDVWFAVWRAGDRLDPAREPWPFIRQTAIRKAIDVARDGRRRRVEPLADQEVVDGRHAQPPPEIPGLDSLPPRHRACLVLFFWEGLSVAEIAAVLAVPPATVKTWMFRARKALRARVAPPADAGEARA